MSTHRDLKFAEFCRAIGERYPVYQVRSALRALRLYPYSVPGDLRGTWYSSEWIPKVKALLDEWGVGKK